MPCSCLRWSPTEPPGGGGARTAAARGRPAGRRARATGGGGRPRAGGRGGVLLALVGVGLHQLTGQEFFDAGASILIGVLLAYIAYRLGRDTKRLLIGEAARPEQREALRRAILAHPEVEAVLQLLTMHLGPGSLLVAVRLDLRDGLSSQQVEAVSTRIEVELAEVVPEGTPLFLEPP